GDAEGDRGSAPRPGEGARPRAAGRSRDPPRRPRPAPACRRAVGRDAAAGAHRHGARRGSCRADRGRSDHGSGRDGAGGAPGAPGTSEARARTRTHSRLARPGRGSAGVRARAGVPRRPGRRGWRDLSGSARSRASVHPLPAVRACRLRTGEVPAMTLLELKGLSVDYGHVRVLDGLSLSLRAGQVVGVVGESGSGKTTLAKAVLRTVDSSTGTVLVDGRDITRLRGSALRRWRRS